jgi:hypothetical protein
MIMCGHKFETAITAFGLSRVSALASSMANILTPSHLLPAEWIFSLPPAFLYSVDKTDKREEIHVHETPIVSPFVRRARGSRYARLGR